VVVNPNGTYTYTPALNYNGSDSFTFQANDGTADSNAATVTIDVAAVNDAPIANPGTGTTTEDTALTSAVTGSDIESTVLAFALAAGPIHGVAVVAADGSYTYTPAANYFGSDSFTFSVSDGQLTSTGTVTLVITAANDAPIATAGSGGTNEDVELTGTVSGSDIDSAALSFLLASGASHGTVVVASNGAYTYMPNANYYGSDLFTFTANDGSLTSVAATVTITVTAVNDAPVAVGDFFSVNEDGSLTGAVLGNDSDLDGPSLAARFVSGPANGSLVLNSDGTFTYTPNANFFGTDAFTYVASDGFLDSVAATATITVTSVNDAPTAVNDSAALNEDGSVSIAVLANDSDVDNASGPANAGLSVTAVGSAANGLVTFTPTGVTYTPAANFFGTDSFTYTVTDPTGLTATATVSVSVAAVNDAPVAQSGSRTTAEDTAFNGTVTSTDVDGPAATYTLVTAAQYGTVLLNLNGTYTYTPNANYNGSDSFSFQASDGSLASNVATIAITVTSVNDAPIAQAGSATTAEDTAFNGTVTSTDVDGPAATYTLVTAAQYGTVLLNLNGTYTYTPNANYNGPDSFTFRASDGSLTSNDATVAITVTSVNDAPTAANDSAALNEDGSVSIAVLANDSDVDNASGPANAGLSVTAVGPAANGLVTFTATGVTYTPNANFFGTDSFTYTISDGRGGTATATVNLTVTPQSTQVYVSNGQLVVNGTTGNDSIQIDSVSGGLRVTLNGIDKGTFAGVNRIRAAGGQGNDSITLESNVNVPAELLGEGGNDTLRGGTGNDSLVGGDGDDSLQATAGDDSLFGGNGNDTLRAGAGNDRLFGEADNDSLIGASGNDLLDGGSGHDTLRAGSGNDTLFGGAGNDSMLAASGDDIFYGGDGDDTINAGSGNDRLYGEGGNDSLIGASGCDLLDGGAGNDTLRGGSGIDQLLGGDGDDSLVGGSGIDTLDGGAGNDTLRSGSGRDTLIGGSGNDSLIGGSGNDFLDGGTGNDTLDGGGGNDILLGCDGNDRLDGGAGADILVGGAGDDCLIGGAGNDLMIGGFGADQLHGNSGDDILIAGNTNYDSNIDVLNSISQTWNSGQSYQSRVQALSGTLEENGSVFDDGAVDQLYGQQGRDWFFANVDGSGVRDIVDATAQEAVEDVDP